MYEANNKLLENYSFRRFESGGIRKTANFVPCVLATKLTVKMAKTLDISRVFVLCAFSGDNSGAPNRTRTCDTSDCGAQNARTLTLRILTAAQKPPPCFRHRRRSVSFQLTAQLTLTETCSLTRSTLFMAKQKQPLTRLLLFCNV